MNVIALRVLAVETKPGSKVKYPRSLCSLPMSTAGSPMLPDTSGSVLVLPDALSVIRTVLSDTAGSLSDLRKFRPRVRGAIHAGGRPMHGARSRQPANGRRDRVYLAP